MTMEPNNTDKQFREKLNSREITPSENSWDRLDAMLTVAEKPKKSYRWMYFAASFLGFILIATVFLNQTEEVIDVPSQKVVIEQNEVESRANQLEKILESELHNNPVQQVVTSEKSVTKQKQEANSIRSTRTQQHERHVTEVAVVSNNKTVTPSIVTREQSSNLRSNQKAEIKVDANALLASVDTRKTNQKNEENTIVVKVNSNDLLSQVDDELELSFRERMLQSVNKKFREVKVAVANRNVE